MPDNKAGYPGGGASAARAIADTGIADTGAVRNYAGEHALGDWCVQTPDYMVPDWLQIVALVSHFRRRLHQKSFFHCTLALVPPSVPYSPWT